MKLTKGIAALALGTALSAALLVACDHGCEGSACTVGNNDGGTVTPDTDFPGLGTAIKECSMPGVGLELSPPRIFMGYRKSTGTGAESAMMPRSDTAVVAYASVCNAGMTASSAVNAELRVTTVTGQAPPAAMAVALPAIEPCACFQVIRDYPGFATGTYQFRITLLQNPEVDLAPPTLSQYSFSPANPGPTQ